MCSLMNGYILIYTCYTRTQSTHYVQFYLIAFALHKPGLFEVDVIDWDEMKGRLQQNRIDFVTEISVKYHCLVGFAELGLDLKYVLLLGLKLLH